MVLKWNDPKRSRIRSIKAGMAASTDLIRRTLMPSASLSSIASDSPPIPPESGWLLSCHSLSFLLTGDPLFAIPALPFLTFLSSFSSSFSFSPPVIDAIRSRADGAEISLYSSLILCHDIQSLPRSWVSLLLKSPPADIPSQDPLSVPSISCPSLQRNRHRLKGIIRRISRRAIKSIRINAADVKRLGDDIPVRICRVSGIKNASR